MNIRTLLVDGSYLLQRSFHGAKDLYTNNFGSIGALYSFLTTIRKLIKQNSINKTVIFFDGESGGIARYNIDHAYKANRKNKSWYNKIELSEAEIKKEKEKEESLLKNKKRIQQYAEELFLRQIEVNEIEADDLISAYVERYFRDEEIFIFTNDRDFIQLLDYGITILFDNIKEPINKTNFFFHFPYHYSNALTVKIICGDTSDNIDNIEGIQLKTLLKFFPDIKLRYYTVREICQKADAINKKRIEEKKKPLKAFENLLKNIGRLKMNYKLINLRKPFLNENALEELEQLRMPLSDKNRGSKYLYKMMVEDEFLTIYNGTFPNYVEPFYVVIMNEKQILKEYLKKEKNII